MSWRGRLNASTADSRSPRGRGPPSFPSSPVPLDHDHLVVRLGEADHLDLGRRTGRTRRRAPGRRAPRPPIRPAGCGRRPSPLGGVGPVLDPLPARGGRPGHVPGRHQWSAAKSHSSQTTPLSSVSPEPSSHSVAGTTPIPTTTRSASSRDPSQPAARPGASVRVGRRASTPTPSRCRPRGPGGGPRRPRPSGHRAHGPRGWGSASTTRHPGPSRGRWRPPLSR